MKHYTTGEWKLTHEDGKKSIIEVKNNAQAKFLTDNMYALRIKGWQAKEGSTGEFYQLK